MFSNADEVLKFVQDNGVEFIDVRFVDLPGIMQHFNVPASSFGTGAFEDGLMFDGSSIRGFQSIHESNMKLIPDPATAYAPVAWSCVTQPAAPTHVMSSPTVVLFVLLATAAARRATRPPPTSLSHALLKLCCAGAQLAPES